MEPEQPEPQPGPDHRKDTVRIHAVPAGPRTTWPLSGSASTGMAATATANKMDISLCLLLCITFRHI